MGTSAARSSSNTEYFRRGDLIPGLQVCPSCLGFAFICLNCLKVNAMDIIAVHKASQWARQWTLDQKGPVLLEMVTYRYGGHS